MKNKYETVNCPVCKTPHQINDTDRNRLIRCLCGKKFMIVAFEGKKELSEV